MADTVSHVRMPEFLRSLLGPFASRPRLTSGICVGLLAYAISSVVAGHVASSTRAIVCWDATCLWFAGLTLLQMRKQTLPDLKAHIAAQDEGQGIIVTVVMIAAAASLAAVGVELSLAKQGQGLMKELRIALAIVTVALSWFTTQLIFALHYAHQFYAPDRTTPEEDDVIGGLQFPGGKEPDNWDFLHFAIVIGVASQTADIAFTKQRLRRVGTVHSLISFAFNTAVLALTINLIAGLFG